MTIDVIQIPFYVNASIIEECSSVAPGVIALTSEISVSVYTGSIRIAFIVDAYSIIAFVKVDNPSLLIKPVSHSQMKLGIP